MKVTIPKNCTRFVRCFLQIPFFFTRFCGVSTQIKIFHNSNPYCPDLHIICNSCFARVTPTYQTLLSASWSGLSTHAFVESSNNATLSASPPFALWIVDTRILGSAESIFSPLLLTETIYAATCSDTFKTFCHVTKLFASKPHNLFKSVNVYSSSYDKEFIILLPDLCMYSGSISFENGFNRSPGTDAPRCSFIHTSIDTNTLIDTDHPSPSLQNT